MPVTINGRIFPREDIDIWSIRLAKGESVHCEAHAARLGSPLDARLEIRDAQGRRLAESDAPTGGDPVLRFTAPSDGEYHVRIQDALSGGSQAHVYRLTLSTEPYIDRVFPLGGRRGDAVELALSGQGVAESASVMIPKEAPSLFSFTFRENNVKSNTVFLEADDHPEYLAAKNIGQTISLPAVLNGQIAKPGQIDDWKWQGKKGETWEFDLRAARLGSRLDGIVTICDEAGKTLMRGEAGPADTLLRYQVPADGVHRVQIQDRFRSRGGPEFAYRLKIAPPPAPDFRLTLAAVDPRQAGWGDAVTVLRKGNARLRLNVERIGGHKEPISLDVQGLPANVTVTPSIIQPNQATFDLTFKADEAAKIGASRLTFVGKTKNGITRTAGLQVGRGMPEQTSVLLAVAMPTPFVIKGVYDMGFGARGTMHKRKYTIERNGYDGPIDVSLADRQARHLQGVEGPTITVPAGAKEFTYSAYLPPWMETGRTCRVCVMGVATIKDADGTENRVSYSSVNQNEQLVTVVGPGMLALEADRVSFTAIPGKPFNVPVRIRRGQGINGPVELTLIIPSHLRGLHHAKTIIPAGMDRGELIVNCGEKLAGPFTMPLTLRATLMRDGVPLIAEGKLDVQP
ncbi:MAG: PPC domain-containing protein [Planctomycetes bacterium]|nr:PPC domain-containing protein [Planctomycetota bacterium]